MSQATKRLEAMLNNPKGDWQMRDVAMVCRAYGIDCLPPRGGGSHFTVSHPSQEQILTIPAHKPIKAVYIVKLVSFIQLVVENES